MSETADGAAAAVRAGSAGSAGSADGAGSADSADGAAPRTIYFQGAGGTCVEISPDAAKLCGLATGILWGVDLDEPLDEPRDAALRGTWEPVLIPVPDIPDRDLFCVAELLEHIAGDAVLCAFCAFLEERRARGDAGVFCAGLGCVRTREPHMLTYDRWIVRLIGFLDYLAADIPLVCAYAALMRYRDVDCVYFDADPGLERDADFARGLEALQLRFVSTVGVLDRESAVKTQKIHRMYRTGARLVRSGLPSAPYTVIYGAGAGGCCQQSLNELHLVARNDPDVLADPHLASALGDAVPRLRRLCVEPATHIPRADPKLFCADFLSALKFAEGAEVVLAPTCPAGDAFPAVMAVVEFLEAMQAGASAGSPSMLRRLVISAANMADTDAHEAAMFITKIHAHLVDYAESAEVRAWDEATVDVGRPGVAACGVLAADVVFVTLFRCPAVRFRSVETKLRPAAPGGGGEALAYAAAIGAEPVLYGRLPASGPDAPLLPVAEFREFGALALPESALPE